MTRPTAGHHPKAARRLRARRRWWYAGFAAVVVVVVAGALVIASAGGGRDDETTAAEDGLVASFEMLDGGTGELADYGGRPLVMNFFASWCAPCLAEMPGFEQVHKDMDGEVEFLGVNLQDPPENGRLVVEQTGVTYDIARDSDGSLFTTVGGFAMPTTVFIDADGVIVDLHSGEISADSLRDRIDEVLLP